MSVARLKACLEAMRGDTVTNALIVRVGGNLYQLTSKTPDPTWTNDQKAAAVLALLRSMTRVLTADGAAAITAATLPQSNIDAINAAAAAAAGDV